MFKSKLNQLVAENRYRHFVELERIVGAHPKAVWNAPDGKRDVTVWCSNDYIGMGHHPDVIAALQDAAGQHGKVSVSAWGGTLPPRSAPSLQQRGTQRAAELYRGLVLGCW